MLLIRTIPLAFLVGIVTACSGPIQTRVDSAASPLPIGALQFHFAQTPGPTNGLLTEAQDAVSAQLVSKGWTKAADTGALVTVTIAERPASIAITQQQDTETHTRVPAKRQKPLQRCKDVEHRLSIAVTDTATGAAIYNASASEYHCKGTLTMSLPYLVRAALKDFGEKGGKSVQTRAGVE